MKILFWILAILSLLVSLFVSFICYMSHGIGLNGTIIGEIVCIVGMLAIVVSVICVVLGIIKLCKDNVKKAVIFALVGVVYSGIIIAGIFIEDAVDTMMMEQYTTERNEQLYGENWNTPSDLDEIPELYQEELNKYYVAVRDKWSADKLMELGVVSMPEYYGDVSLDNIGFALKDINSDGNEELMIGTVAPVKEGGTAIFCIYSDPKNPFLNLISTEGETYYLHFDDADGIYMAEISGENAVWLLEAKENESIVDITYQESVLEPADRMTLEMIPFSKYK